jgi:hypothetical protein
MPAMTTELSGTLRRETVDAYLGPHEKRFFGKGYKRAQQRLTDISLVSGPGEKGFARGRASVSYPSDWSKKGDRHQPPHLSSIDVLLLTGEIADLYLTHSLRLDPAERSAMLLRRIRIKAGRKPVEDALGDFPVEAVISRRGSAAGRPGFRLSEVDCLVGELRARCEVEHPEGREHTAPAVWTSPDELLGPAETRPYGAAHKWKSHEIRDLAVDVGRRYAEAVFDVRCELPEGIHVQGLESYSQNAVSIVDFFAVAMQLGQILLYELDRISRADSNTLWMRQTLLEIGRPGEVLTGPSPLTARLEEAELLTSADGKSWRTADIVAESRGLAMRCSVAHQLPRSTS